MAGLFRAGKTPLQRALQHTSFCLRPRYRLFIAAISLVSLSNPYHCRREYLTGFWSVPTPWEGSGFFFLSGHLRPTKQARSLRLSVCISQTMEEFFCAPAELPAKLYRIQYTGCQTALTSKRLAAKDIDVTYLEDEINPFGQSVIN